MSLAAHSATNSNCSYSRSLWKLHRAEDTFTHHSSALSTKSTFLPIQQGLCGLKLSVPMAGAAHSLLQEQRWVQTSAEPAGLAGTAFCSGLCKHKHLGHYLNKRLTLILMGDISTTVRTAQCEDSVSQKPFLWESFLLKNNLTYF